MRRTRGLDGAQGQLGGVEQFAALAGARLGERRVAADDQALARVIGAGDLDEIALVEQRDLQRAIIGGECLDIGGAQRGDPVEPSRFELLGDARLGDHPAITDQDHAAQTKALPQLVDLDLELGWVGGVAGENFDRHRTAGGRAQHTKDDLPLVGFAVTAVAEARQRAATTFQIGRGHVVEHQCPLGEVAARQLGFDPALLRQ